MTTAPKPMSPEGCAFWRGYRLGLRRGRARLRALELAVEDRLVELQDECEAAAEKLGSDDAIEGALAAGRVPDDPRG